MKKRIITLLLALVFIIPCMFALASCGEDPCAHAEAEHGLCKCGKYLGTTLEINKDTIFDGVKDETIYLRYPVQQGQHYGRNLTAFAEEVKQYAKYSSDKWTEVRTYSVFDVVPTDGYIYVEITPTSSREITINMYTTLHANSQSAPKLEIGENDTEATLDLTDKSGFVCAQLKLAKGSVYEIEAGTIDSQICIGLSGVYANGAPVQTTESQGKLILDLTSATADFDGHLHAYINSSDQNYITVTKQA